LAPGEYLIKGLKEKSTVIGENWSYWIFNFYKNEKKEAEIMEENCFLQNLTIVTHGKWTKWASWGECQFVTFPRE
jgi:hypothetical protein